MEIELRFECLYLVLKMQRCEIDAGQLRNGIEKTSI